MAQTLLANTSHCEGSRAQMFASQASEIDEDWIKISDADEEEGFGEMMETLAALEAHEQDLMQQLEDHDNVARQKRNHILNQLEDVRAEKLPLVKAVESLNRSATKFIGVTSLTFLESHLWNVLCCAVVVMNMVLMLEHNNIPPSLGMCLDQLILTWYVIELSLALYHFRKSFFIGSPSRVAFNWLDAVIVFTGVLDQWLRPIATSLLHSGDNSSSSWIQCLRLLRLFRLFRLVKLVKAFLLSDSAWLLESDAFNIAMSVVIAVNSMVMAFEIDLPWGGWSYVDNVFMAVYFLEVALKLKAWSWMFFVHTEHWKWNWLDFIIVSTGVFDSWLMPGIQLFQREVLGQESSHPTGQVAAVMKLLRLARLLRVLRLVRLLRAIPALYKLLNGIMFALGAMKWVICLTLIMLYGSAILFTNFVGQGLIFGEDGPNDEAMDSFGTVSDSLFSLFKLMNGDQAVVQPICSNIWGKLLFAGFTIVSNWAILAILTSVVSDNMIASSDQFAKEQALLEKTEEDKLSQRRLMRVFERANADSNGFLDKEEWAELFKNEELLNEMVDSSDMDEAELRSVFPCMVEDQLHRASSSEMDPKNPKIDYNTFVRHLAHQNSTADRRSVLHVMMRLRLVDEKINHGLEGIFKILKDHKQLGADDKSETSNRSSLRRKICLL